MPQAVDLLNEVATSTSPGEEEIYSTQTSKDFEANIAEQKRFLNIFFMTKFLLRILNCQEPIEKSKAVLASHKVDADHYKLYTELNEKETKALAEAVTKLGTPNSRYLGGDESGR